MPARPKPGVGQGRRANVNISGALGGVGLPSSAGRTPALSGGSGGMDSEGNSVTAASPDTTGYAAGPGAITRPSTFAMMVNPQLAQAYANYAYNVAPSQEGETQRTGMQVQGQKDVESIRGKNQLANTVQEGANTVNAEKNRHVLDTATRLGVDPERVPDLQAAMYPDMSASAMSGAKEAANISAARTNATSNPEFQSAVTAGVNAEQQKPFFQNLALGGKMEAGPGQNVRGFGDIYNSPLSLSGPTSTVSTRGTTSGMRKDPVTGLPQQFSTETNGNTYGGGSTSQPTDPIQLQAIHDVWKTSQDADNTATAPAIDTGDSGGALPGQTMPNTITPTPKPLGPPSSLAGPPADFLSSPVGQWLIKRITNAQQQGYGAQTNPSMPQF